MDIWEQKYCACDNDDDLHYMCAYCYNFDLNMRDKEYFEWPMEYGGGYIK